MKKYIFVIFLVCILTLTSAVYGLEADDSTISGLNIKTDIDGAFNGCKMKIKL